MQAIENLVQYYEKVSIPYKQNKETYEKRY